MIFGQSYPKICPFLWSHTPFIFSLFSNYSVLRLGINLQSTDLDCWDECHIFSCNRRDNGLQNPLFGFHALFVNNLILTSKIREIPFLQKKCWLSNFLSKRQRFRSEMIFNATKTTYKHIFKDLGDLLRRKRSKMDAFLEHFYLTYGYDVNVRYGSRV